MRLEASHLQALAAVLRLGSFEKAARQLNLTPSAVSQRIRALEERLGTVLVVRGQPCLPTPAGQRLARHAEDVALLEQDLWQDIGSSLPDAGGGSMPGVRVAINADSLATWFVAAMQGAGDLLFDLQIDDQDHSAGWLRRGEVRAAVSADPAPVQGCDVVPLGALAYRATASPAFMRRWFAGGVDVESLARAPAMIYNLKDGLQAAWVRQSFDQDVVLPAHYIASTHAFVDAAAAGIGWGMNPEPLVRAHLMDGRLEELVPGTPLTVPLYWHISRSAAPGLQRLTQAVRAAAADQLLTPVK
ncbi:LysR family transcriptional regulator ArgP [Pannonibacter sp. Q-1]